MDFISHLWWIGTLLALGLLIGLQVAIKKFFSFLGQKQARSQADWRHSLGSILHPPVALVIWAVGIGYILDGIGHHFDFFSVNKYFYPLRGVVVIGAFVWLWMRWWGAFQKYFLSDKYPKADPTTVHMVGRIITVGVVAIAALLAMQILGVNTAPLVAFGSIGAASIGFAGKDVVANFCSGFLLHLARPFVMGDTIHIPEKSLEGVVEDIGWFRTLIRDKNKRAVYLPNNFFSTMLLLNESRLTHRRFKQTISLPLEAVHAIAGIVEQIQNLFKTTPEIDLSQSLYVYFSSYGERGCEIELEAYSTLLEQESFYRLQQHLLLQIQAILDKAKVQVAPFTVKIKNYIN